MRHVVEWLEKRVFLSNAPFGVTSRGTLYLDGTVGADVISITGDGQAVIVSLNVLKGFRMTNVKRIWVEGAGGRDSIDVTIKQRIPVTILGGSGNDTITVSGPAVTLVGGQGNDVLSGRGDAGITFIGGRGSDTLSGSDGIDTFHGGAGDDAAQIVHPSETYTSIERLSAVAH